MPCILAHYYQESEIQDIADIVGDSLELSRRAADNKADVIVFAGRPFHGGDREDPESRASRSCFRI